jgi:hypothetical protein
MDIRSTTNILRGSKHLYEEARVTENSREKNSTARAYFPTAETSKLHKATANMNVALYMCRNYSLRTDFVHVKSVGHKLEAFHPCVCNCHLTNFIVFHTFVFSNNNQRCSQSSVVGGGGRSGARFRYGQEIVHSSKMLRPPLASTQPPLQSVPGLSPGCKAAGA